MSFASYQVGAPEGAQPDTSNLLPEGARPVNLRIGNTVTSVNGDTVQTMGITSINTANLPNGETGALATGRTPWGSPRAASELKPSDLITISGQEMTIQIAERIGLLERDPMGRYVEVPNGVERLTEEPKQAVPEDLQTGNEQALGEKEEQALASICAQVSPGTQVSVMSQLIEHGELNPNTLHRAASESGIHPDVLSGQLDPIIAGFKAQADATVKALGAEDTADFWDWAQEHAAKDLSDAMRKHGMMRTTKAYEPLYQRYVEGLADRDADAILNARLGGGITAQKIDGKVVLNLPGVGQVPYSVAVKRGLITVRGA